MTVIFRREIPGEEGPGERGRSEAAGPASGQGTPSPGEQGGPPRLPAVIPPGGEASLPTSDITASPETQGHTRGPGTFETLTLSFPVYPDSSLAQNRHLQFQQENPSFLRTERLALEEPARSREAA